MASLVLSDSSQLTSDSQQLGEREQLAALSLVTGYMHLLGSALQDVFTSKVHFEKVVIGLVQVARLDTSGVSVLGAPEIIDWVFILTALHSLLSPSLRHLGAKVTPSHPSSPHHDICVPRLPLLTLPPLTAPSKCLGYPLLPLPSTAPSECRGYPFSPSPSQLSAEAIPSLSSPPSSTVPSTPQDPLTLPPTFSHTIPSLKTSFRNPSSQLQK
uniref:Uncharacterized protein n=1 Tax=Timema genevievae TaxID=629358 RepID=A0A7R9JUR8_TIMGE|nr:unnamed protein product [Timema genevievae]